MFDLKEIRHGLHERAELAKKEKQTSDEIIKHLKACNPDELETGIGGNGIIALFDTQKPGPAVLIRAELDGLPIAEENNFDYVSKNKGVSHSCGHDGHMSVLLGVAEKLNTEKNNLWGKIYLLFQPAEEIAKGAKDVLEDSKFKYLHIDYVFALHNLPGFGRGKIILKKGVFAATSKGLKINLKGKSSHAGHPENGNNPVFGIMDIINGLTEISKEANSAEDISLITIIHAKLGEVAFGTSPGEGVVMATFRSTSSEKMNFMSKKAVDLIEQVSAKYKLKHEIDWVEVFPILKNDDESVDIIKKAAEKKKLETVLVDKPFSWTEDFSYFTQKYKGAFFGLGSGINQPQLHNPDYDFPDEILPAGVDIFIGIIKEILDLDNKEKKIE